MRRFRNPTAYEVLNVPNDASEDQIKQAYRTSTRLTHPDKGGSPALFRTVTEAYELLSNQRAEYNDFLRAPTSSGFSETTGHRDPWESDPTSQSHDPWVEDLGTDDFTDNGSAPPASSMARAISLTTRGLSHLPAVMQLPAILALLASAIFSLSRSYVSFADFKQTTTSDHGIGGVGVTTEAIPLSHRFVDLLTSIGSVALAVVLVLVALILLAMRMRWKKLLPLLDGEDRVSLHRLAAMTNTDVARTHAIVQQMINSGLLKKSYIDHRTGDFVSMDLPPMPPPPLGEPYG